MTIGSIMLEIKGMNKEKIKDWMHRNPDKAVSLIDFLSFTHQVKRPGQRIWD